MDDRPRPFAEALTLDQLTMLMAIVDHGSFSTAARVVGRSQGGVSYQIQRLEEQLTIKLFDRSGHVPKLTAEGQRVVEHARRVLAEVDTLRDRAWGWSRGVEPRLRLAVDVLFPADQLVALASEVQARFPSVALSVVTGFVRFAAQQVRAGDADIAISGPLGVEGLDQRLIGAVQMIPVAAPHHPLAAQGIPGQSHLESHVHLLLTHGAGSGADPSEGFASPRRWALGDARTRLAFLRAGLGWARLPDHEAEPEIAAGRLAPIDMSLAQVQQDRVPICVATTRAARLGAAGRWVYDHVRMEAIGGQREATLLPSSRRGTSGRALDR